MNVQGDKKGRWIIFTLRNTPIDVPKYDRKNTITLKSLDAYTNFKIKLTSLYTHKNLIKCNNISP